MTLAPVSAHAGLDPISVAPSGLEPVSVAAAGRDGPWLVDGAASDATIRHLGAGHSRLSVGASDIQVLQRTEPTPAGDTASSRREVLIGGWRVVVDLEPAARADLRARARRTRAASAGSGPTDVRAMIPGVVVAVLVTAGDRVSAGQKLVIIEAMKMQNEVLAPRDGVIDRVSVNPGARIELADLLMVIS